MVAGQEAQGAGVSARGLGSRGEEVGGGFGGLPRGKTSGRAGGMQPARGGGAGCWVPWAVRAVYPAGKEKGGCDEV